MRITRNLFKFSTVLKHKMPLITSKQPLKFGLMAGLTFGTAYWFSSKKVMSEEMSTFEMDDNLGEGEMRELQVGPKLQDTVLVIRYQGKVYCTQSKCAHFGFSLSKGFLSGDKVICPLHNAGFSIKTGKPDQGPIFNGLKTFPVEVSNGKIKVQVPKNGWDQPPPVFEVDGSKLDRSKKIVIIGAGPAALSAADTLRQTGYKGYIYMVTREKETPYDRTMLSKMSDAEKKPGPIRTQQFYSRNGIIFVKDANVTGIDYDAKKVKIQSKDSLPYDKLLIASGCVNRVPPITGLKDVQYYGLRTIRDYEAINKAVRESGAKNITIIGAGFIGIETASALKAALKDQVTVTLVEQGKAPLQHVLGETVGSLFKDLAEKNGVNITTDVQIKEIKGTSNKPTSVVHSKGSIPTDVLIVATGVQSSMEFAPELIEKELNGIKCNIFLQTDKSGVFAAGDVASYPYWYTGQRTRIEHYNEAIYQGSVAALNIMGKKMPMDNIPFFWTRSFNNTLSFTGYTKGWDDIHIVGDVKEMKFIAYYIDKKKDKVLGVASMGIMNHIQIINEAMRNGEMLPASKIKSPDFKVEDLIDNLKKSNPKCTRCGNMQECS